MYSQRDEEKWIVDFYKGFVGRFLDLGANDGVSLSCTRRLVELGWSGVCVEPAPSVFVKLQKLYFDNLKVIVVNCAVDIDSKIKEFYHYPNGYISTLSRDFIKLWPKHKKNYQSMYLKTVKFSELLSCFGDDFSFLKIDIEGMDFEILKFISFSSLPKLNMICIEHCRKKLLSQMIEIGRVNGFYKLAVTPQNLILAKQ